MTSAFISLKSVSDNCYAEAVSKPKEIFTWKRKAADQLFLAVHGNTQNGQIARDDWKPLLREDTQWQLETILLSAGVSPASSAGGGYQIRFSSG